MHLIKEIEACASRGEAISPDLALGLSVLDEKDAPLLFPAARRLRVEASGNRAYLCSIVNAKSGRCGEDCRFCAQSARYGADIKTYPLLSLEEIMSAAGDAKRNSAGEFSIVTSGKGVSDPGEVERMGEAISRVRDLGMDPCASPGIIAPQVLEQWKQKGLVRFHHNLESSRSFFKEVCTTHGYDEDVEVVRAAKELGLKVCCGGIFGMGESWEQRVELALMLRELDVDSVPVNFLNPIPGTPMAEAAPGISALDALKTVAMIRLLIPGARVILCGGREKNLRDLQSFAFEAGASGLLIGNYLTTPGRPPEQDLQLIRDLGMEPAS